MIETVIELNGELNNSVKRVYPELSNLEVNPSLVKQVFKHEGSYGYDEVVVNAIPSDYGSVYKPRFISFQNYTGTDLDYELTNLDTSLIYDFSMMFSACQNVTSLPAIDTSNGTLFDGMYNWCPKLEQAPQIDTSNGTSFGMMYQGCGSLTSVPDLDTSKGKNFNNMYGGCMLLTEIPNLNTSNGTDFSYFANSTGITSFPNIDTSNGTSFSGFVNYCEKLITFPNINTSKATNVSYMFDTCTSLVTIPEINCAKATNVAGIVSNCPALENLGGFKNLGQSFSLTAVANYYAYRIDLSSSPNLTHDSLMNVINKLYNIKGRGCKSQALVLGDNLQKLTSTERNIATNKGWTLS